MAAEFRREAEDVRRDCSGFDLKHISDCAITLTTGHPLHIAFGSIAPQNGLGLGVALVGHLPSTDKWTTNWSADVVGSFSGAWRAGAYMKFVNTNVKPIVVIPNPDPTQPSPPQDAIHPYPVYTAYVQSISLPKLLYYGLGPSTLPGAKSFFGFDETIVGGNAIVPISRTGRINLSLLGEMNGRFAGVHHSQSDDRPSIEEIYTEATAPGLTSQPGVLQFGEGARIKPALLNGGLNLNYLVQFQQFIAPSDATYSFRRWTIDLDHEVPLYRTSRPPVMTRDTNTPNQCAIDPKDDKCPSVSRNRTGTVAFRVLVSRSDVGSDSVVPFYFQRTLGGSDINGERLLASFDDYRFRGPHLFLLQESLEHSLGSWPVGVWLAAEQGRVSLQDDNGDSGDIRYSVAAGLTLRAGGFPVVVLSFATGSSEGGHVAFTIGTSLLGGSPRPSLH
jgi:hypothetical protein